MIGFFKKIGTGLAQGLKSIFSSKPEIAQETLTQLAELLLGADMGVAVTERLIGVVRESIEKKADYQSLKQRLKDETKNIFIHSGQSLDTNFASNPCVILMMGINGVGKTTTIGKIAALFKRDGKSVLLAAGDTFRAGAIQQLSIWGKRVGVGVITALPGADPSSVAFNAVQAAVAQKIDYLLVDTAGRLESNRNLMEELKKMTRVMAKIVPDAPHQRILVLDATTGQNSIVQAKRFHEGIGLTGLIMTKLDTTARGGGLIAIVEALRVPILYVTTGEGVDDIAPFQVDSFVEALFDEP